MRDTPAWVPRISDRRGAVYRAIADALAADVAAGRLAPGTRLPTHRALAEALGVTVGTVTRAYAEAERRGLVDATVGRGSFVRAPERPFPDPGAPDDSGHPAMSPAQWHDGAVDRAGAAAGRGLVELSVNYPVHELLAEAIRPSSAALQDPARLAAIAGYQPSNGRAEHRAAAARWLAGLGLEADPGDLVLTHGCQGGLTLALATLTRPGDAVLVEHLTWPGLQSLTQLNALRAVPVAGDGDGLDPEALRRAARQSGARVVYCMPTLHNPTNVTMPEARRRALLQVAREEDLILIEDDVYGFLAGPPQTPLAALDPARTIYLTSLSKCVAPGLRLGILKGPRALVPRFATTQRATSLMVSAVAAEIAARLIDGGHAQQAAAAQRAEAEARQTLAARHLAGLATARAPASFHVWLRLPAAWDTAGFVAAALNRGISVTPGTAFTVDGTDPRAVRLCLAAAADRRALDRALSELGALARERPETLMPVV
jgi:DNA-binding transcriptional MocR family regulator